jgi:hypothetical protein
MPVWIGIAADGSLQISVHPPGHTPLSGFEGVGAFVSFTFPMIFGVGVGVGVAMVLLLFFCR